MPQIIRPTPWPRFLGLLAVTLVAFAALAEAQRYPKLAPYSAVRWTADEVPEAQLGGDGTWIAVLAIDDLQINEIIAFARERYRDRWQKRIDEDLVEILSEMGHPPGPSVRLTVRDLESGEESVREDVRLTAENRHALMRAKYPERGRPPAQPVPPPEASSGASQRAVLFGALESFREALGTRWSYRHANGADFEGAIAALGEEVGAGISRDAFVDALGEIVALGIDGHAAVAGGTPPKGSFLPFLVEPSGARFVAFAPDRESWVAEGFPYLTKVDGQAISTWCEAASLRIPKGSPQYRQRHCLRHLRELERLRGVLGLPNPPTVVVELTDEKATTPITLTLRVSERLPSYGRWPRRTSGRLENGIGYLRLERMDEDGVAEIEAWMPKLRDTRALIVDVRDNGGGSRQALLALDAYLAPRDAAPRVVNTAAYRLHPEHEDDHLEARFMYRAEDSRWSDAERQAITRFAAEFRPSWRPPAGQFSDWHYLVLGGPRVRDLVDVPAFHYDKPVAVLMNAKCFSATDIFLAGLKGLPNVLLVGTPSGGGSARTQVVPLPGLPARLAIGSMASFQVDGKLFDGHGVHPDVLVEPAASYFIGGEDNVLLEAIREVGRVEQSPTSKETAQDSSP